MTETDWNSAPPLLDGAMNLRLTAAQCNLDYWFTNVAQGTLADLVDGHRAGISTPEHMRTPGPLRAALITELGFRTVAEEKATRAISRLVETAPGLAEMEFYATQLIDEARHARVFRNHIVDLGVAPDDLDATIGEYAGKDIQQIIAPLEEFSQPVRDAGDFIGGVILLTVLVEGVLAPTAELSERKWRILDPAAAEVERGAGIDEIRHLTVGSDIVREHLIAHPEEAPRIGELIGQGQQLWASVPVLEMLGRREALFQEGMVQYADLLGDYELEPGRRLIDTTAEERVTLAMTWAAQMQESRLAYMGLRP